MKDNILNQLENKTLKEIMDEAKANQKPIPISTQLLVASFVLLIFSGIVITSNAIEKDLTWEEVQEDFINDIIHPYECSSIQKIVQYFYSDDRIKITSSCAER